jgi:hypothetical protein
MPHKVGLHLLHHPAASRIIPLIEKLRPAVIKSLGSAAYLANLADSLKNVLDYEPKFVARFWWKIGSLQFLSSSPSSSASALYHQGYVEDCVFFQGNRY